MTRQQLAATAMGFVVAFCGLVSVGHVSAQESDPIRITTSPSVINIMAKPGETVVREIKIQNDGSSALRLRAGLMKFSANGEAGNPALAEREPADAYFDWVDLSPREFDAPPGEIKTVKVSIRIPKEAALGYYYAVVFGPSTDPLGRDGGTSVRGAAAVLVLLDVEAPQARREIEIAKFTVGKRIYEFLPVSFDVNLKNNGNIHSAPTGTIFITQGNRQISTVEVNKGGGNVLPNSGRNFTASWQDGFPFFEQAKQDDGTVQLDERGRPKTKLNYNLADVSKLRFGKYTARLVIVYRDKGRDVPTEATVDFWVVPWRLIAIAIAVPLIPAVLVFLLMRRRKKSWHGRR